MPSAPSGTLARVVRAHQPQILSDWMGAQHDGAARRDPVQEAEQRQVSKEFLGAMVLGLDGSHDMRDAGWTGVREILTAFSANRAGRGFTPSDTATFVFSLKQPVFTRLRSDVTEAEGLVEELWGASRVIDDLGLFTAEEFHRTRADVIRRQQQELLELSTPVVELWEGILALPLIGTLDSNRTQVVMESLLEKIVAARCSIAIIDITGVPTVDTLVAQHLMKTVAAARLMGADCIISGIRPQIAQTIVHLGVDLSHVTTKASMHDAFRTALARIGQGLRKI